MVNVLYIVAQSHEKSALDHFRNFKGIQSTVVTTSKLKKRKFKTKSLLKITNNVSPQYNQQTEPKQCKSEVEEICIHLNQETGPIATTISENKQWIPC